LTYPIKSSLGIKRNPDPRSRITRLFLDHKSELEAVKGRVPTAQAIVHKKGKDQKLPDKISKLGKDQEVVRVLRGIKMASLF